MKGVMIPSVSAGSNQREANVMWTPHVIVPSGAAVADPAAPKRTMTASSTTRIRETNGRMGSSYLPGLGRSLKMSAQRHSRATRASALLFRDSGRDGLSGRGTLGVDIESVQRPAGRHEEAVALRAAEAEVAADLGQADAPDELALGRPHGHPTVAKAAPAGVAVARDPEVAKDVAADAVRPAFDAVDHEVGEELLVGELVVAADVKRVHVAVAARVGVARPSAGADHVQLLVVGREG